MDSVWRRLFSKSSRIETISFCSWLWKDRAIEEKERNVGSETVQVSSPAPVKRGKNAERRINFGDTFIKNLKPKNKLYSIGDSKMAGLRLRIEPTGSKIFYYFINRVDLILRYSPLTQKKRFYLKYKYRGKSQKFKLN